MSAQRSNAGPLSSSYLKIPERFDRPIIRTFQKHPANQIPDAQILSKVKFLTFFPFFLVLFYRFSFEKDDESFATIG